MAGKAAGIELNLRKSARRAIWLYLTFRHWRRPRILS